MVLSNYILQEEGKGKNLTFGSITLARELGYPRTKGQIKETSSMSALFLNIILIQDQEGRMEPSFQRRLSGFVEILCARHQETGQRQLRGSKTKEKID